VQERGGDETVDEVDLIRWSEALAGIARTGLAFSENLYERERYEEVLHVAAEIRAAAGRAHPEGTVASTVQEWLRIVESGPAGYVTPKVAVGAVVSDAAGRILLLQRSDSGVWLYPTGWADIGYSPSEVAVKEVREETGIDVEVVRLLGVFDGLRLGFTRIPLYSLVFLCRAVGGELSAHPLEAMDVGWFHPDDLPHPVAGVDHWGPHVFAALRGEEVDVLYDLPRDRVWVEGDDAAEE
jgi:ADP-ribose pyrophosphatase YjhB (NUDIX family)